jgi:undecaprenyl-diphosphatase
MTEIDIHAVERNAGEPEQERRVARGDGADDRAAFARALIRRLDDRLGRARWTCCVVLLAVFALLLWQVRSSGLVPALDARVRAHVVVWAAAPWARPVDPWAHRLADLGDVIPAIPVLLIVAAIVAVRRRSSRPALMALLALAWLAAVVVPAKLLIARPGPGGSPLSGHHLGYFPSGHTADAMMCYGTAALIVVAGGSRALRRVVGAFVCLLIAVIGMALIWCDYHWTSDVFGSLTLCGAALVLLPATWRHRDRNPSHCCTPGR